MKNDDPVAVILRNEPCDVSVLSPCQGLNDPEPMLSPSQHTSQEQCAICLFGNDQMYFKRTALLLGCTLPLAYEDWE